MLLMRRYPEQTCWAVNLHVFIRLSENQKGISKKMKSLAKKRKFLNHDYETYFTRIQSYLYHTVNTFQMLAHVNQNNATCTKMNINTALKQNLKRSQNLDGSEGVKFFT